MFGYFDFDVSFMKQHWSFDMIHFISSICKNHIVWYDFDLSFLFETIVQIIFKIIMDINNS
jgi:hypothetical protein